MKNTAQGGVDRKLFSQFVKSQEIKRKHKRRFRCGGNKDVEMNVCHKVGRNKKQNN